MSKISKSELEENYWARIESESYSELTPEQEKQGEKFRKQLADFYKKYEKKEKVQKTKNS